MHWSDAYIGRPYVPDEFDCSHLAELVAREQLGIAVRLPEAHARGGAAQAAQIASLVDDYARPTDTPRDGAPVLMRYGSRYHLGVYCGINGEAWVLHALRSAGQVVRHRVRDLPTLNLRIEGYYEWI